MLAEDGLVLPASETVVTRAGGRSGGYRSGRLFLALALWPTRGLLALLNVAQELDLGRAWEAERGGERGQWKGSDVERVLVAVEVHGAHVRHECALCEVLELRVVECKCLQLVLDALHLGVTWLDAFDRDALVPERGEHAILLAGEDEEECRAVCVVSRGAPGAVDVRVGRVRRIDLDYPVDGREIEAARSDVRCEECSMLTAGIFVEDAQAAHLLLLAMQCHERDARAEAAEHLVHELHLAA